MKLYEVSDMDWFNNLMSTDDRTPEEKEAGDAEAEKYYNTQAADRQRMENKARAKLKDTLTDEQAMAFANAAATQRAKPERAMLNITQGGNAGAWGNALEHIGDLTHRIMEKPKFNLNRGLEFVSEKLDAMIRSLETHNLGGDFMRQQKANYDYDAENSNGEYDTFEKYLDNLKKMGKIYSNEHRKVPVFNKPQWLAREAAIAIGELRFDDSLRALKELDKIAKAEDYPQQASKFTPNYKPS